MEALTYFAIGALTVVGLALLILTVVGTVMAFKTKTNFNSFVNDMDQRFSTVYSDLNSEIKELDQRINEVHNVLDSRVTEATSYIDSRIDKLQAKTLIKG